MANRKVDPYTPDEDTPELTDEQIKELRPSREVFAELGIPMPRTRGRPPVDTPKKQVTLRLDEEVVRHFKQGGRGWQTRINDTLVEAIKAGK